MGLSLRGTTSGAIDINAPAVAGDNTITLPANNGSANQFFKNSTTAGTVTYSSMVETSTGVGIGSTQPTTNLDVYGYTELDNLNVSGVSTFGSQISLLNGGSQYGFLKESGSGNTELGGTTDLKLSTDGTERVRITSGGSVGIGTDPSAGYNALTNGLVVKRGGTNEGITIDCSNQGGLFFSNGTDSGEFKGQLIYYHSDHSMRMIVNGGEKCRITGIGSVAIGTYDPPEKLSIENGNIFIRDTSDNESYIYFTHSSTANRRSYIGAVEGTGNSNSLVFATNGDGLDGAERLRITSSGKVGINTTSPNATLTVGSVDTPGFNRGSVAIKALTDGNSLPTNIYLEEESGAEGYQLSIDSNGDLNFHNSGAADPTVTFSDDNKVGINKAAPTQALDVVGRIIKTEYEPGELIECLETIANGIQCTLSSGSYTPTNVTATQDLTSSYADINGSVFTYNVPAGTKRLVYDFWVYMKDKDVGPLLHFRGLVTTDGTSSYTTVNDSRSTWRGSTANADYQTWIHNRMVLFDNSSEDLSDGLLNSLGGTTRKIKFQCREYSGSYEGQLHTTNNYDGAGTDILVRPHIRISAYA